LERLFLHSNQVRDRGAEALARSPNLGNLRELFIGNRITRNGADLLRSRFGRGANIDETNL
jgi:hypothetical protein